jgi:uncharacterized membrane protein YoaK (UPF0700 family)
MFKHHFDETPDNIVVLHWFMLSFSGGCINAGGFLATGKFVSHVTGFATLFGVGLMKGQAGVAAGILAVPLFFLLGAFIAGLLIDWPIHRGMKPHFDWVMGLCATCLILTAGEGEIFHFGMFESIRVEESFFLMMLLCLASGLQNGAITSSSGKSVRTTHLTGLTTDLGLGLARTLTLGTRSERLQKEARANYLRIGSILSFVLGSAVGAWFFVNLGYRGFLIPAVIAIYAAWHGRLVKIAPHQLPPP